MELFWFILSIIVVIITFAIYLIGFPILAWHSKKSGEDKKVWISSYLVLGGYALYGYCMKLNNPKWAKRWIIITSLFLVIQFTAFIASLLLIISLVR